MTRSVYALYEMGLFETFFFKAMNYKYNKLSAVSDHLREYYDVC